MYVTTTFKASNVERMVALQLALRGACVLHCLLPLPNILGIQMIANLAVAARGKLPPLSKTASNHKHDRHKHDR